MLVQLLGQAEFHRRIAQVQPAQNINGNRAVRILVRGAKGATEQGVDQKTGAGQPQQRALKSQRFGLGGLGVAVVSLAGHT